MLTPRISQILYLVLENKETNEVEEYKTRVADFKGNELLVEMPINVANGRMRKFNVNQAFSAHFMTSDGIKHLFNTKVTGYHSGNIPLLSIEKPNEQNMKQVQRRNFFRVEVQLDIAVKNAMEKRAVYKTDDIGGGGVSFIVERNDYYNVGEILECWVVLAHRNNSIEHATFIGEVLRIKELESGRKIVMMQYHQINEPERQKIIRFLFEKQIEYKEK